MLRKDKVPVLLPVFLIILFLYSPFSQISGLANVLSGNINNLTIGEGGLLSRVGRELLLAVIYGYWFLWHAIFRQQPFVRVSKTSRILIFVSTMFLVIKSAAALLSLQMPLLLIAHIRLIEYIPLGFIFYSYLKRSSSAHPLFSKGLVWVINGIIVLQLLVCLFELKVIPSFYGTTFLGPRVMGLYESPNTLGVTILALWFLLVTLNSRNLVIDGLVILTLLLAGTRTALITFVIIAFYQWSNHRASLTRLTSRILGFASLPILVLLFSMSSFSGRTIQGEGRVDVLSGYMQNLTPLPMIVGDNWGISSNVIISLFGGNAFDKLFIADSMYLYIFSNFGIVGFLLIFLLLFQYTRNVSPEKRKIGFLFGIMLLLLSVSVVIVEAYPLNLIMVLLMAYLQVDNVQAHGPQKGVCSFEGECKPKSSNKNPI